MATIYVHKVIESEFNSLQELMDLFYQHAYNGIVLGVKFGDKLATVEQKKIYKGVCGWLISYGRENGKGFMCESKATEPSDFKVSLHCSELYKVETL